MMLVKCPKDAASHDHIVL